MFYLPEKILTPKIRYTVSHALDYNVNGYILYAYTTKKKYVNRFLEERINDFKLIEKVLTKEEFKSIQNNIVGYELREWTYHNFKSNTVILSTCNEYNHCKYSWINLIDPKIFSYIPYTIIDALEDEYRYALYKLGLNGMILVADEELSQSGLLDDISVLDENSILHIESGLGTDVTLSLKLRPKEMNVFIHQFKSLFK